MMARVRPSTLLFAGVATTVYATAVTLVTVLPELERPGAVAAGITLDLVVLVPLAFYALVLRRRDLPVATLAPALLLSLVAAALVLPRDHHQTLRTLTALVIPLEAGLLGFVVWRAAQALRRSRTAIAIDPLEQLRRAAREALPWDRAAEILATEAALFYYAFGAWRAKPHVPAGAYAFTQHRRSGQGGIVFALLVLIAAEGLAVHLLLARWSVVAAWVLTIGSLYGALWLVADYRATVLRPILVDAEDVWIRAGLRWSLRLPRAAISAVQRTKPAGEGANLQLPLVGTPTYWITLSEPMQVQGPYGIRHRASALGLTPDAPEDLSRVLHR